jgi:large subunit ribosomal protein L9
VKVILRQDVPSLGERGRIVNVAAGYARNYLLPKGLAWEATPGNIRTLELQRKAWQVRDLKAMEEARAVAERIGALQLEVAKKAGESATLYGSVTASEIADLLAARGYEVDRRKVVLEEPIKTLGEFTVPVKLHSKVTAEVKVRVVAEAE